MSSSLNHHLIHNIPKDDDDDLDLEADSFPVPCQHLADFRTCHGAKPFRALQDCLRVKPFGRASIQRDPNEVPLCRPCGEPSPRLYACLACADLFCRRHAPDHAVAEPSHIISIDIDRAELFCFACKDQVYDRDFDAAVFRSQKTLCALKSSSCVQRPPKPANLRKRKRADYRPWTPDLQERAIIRKNTSPLINAINGLNSEFPWGLRGLNNLGNTCFMNSVLQALLHTPPLRNYFLSDRHNRYYCKQKGVAGKKNGSIRDGSGKGIQLCLACDMDEMYSAVFSGERTSFSPSNFLHSWWQHAENLASYEQQDAHEFFISMLDGMHEKAQSDRPKPQNQGNGDCCIAHRVFSGILRSDVMCSECGFTSTTYDPCVDISLDLEANKKSTTKMTSSKKHNSPNAKAGCKASTPDSVTPTLTGCLDRFTRPERLGSSQKFFCQKCQVRQESLKQMSLRKLPLVSCFHIKRFEHSSVRKMSRKIDRYLQFPLSLDMEPYLSSSIIRTRFGNRMFPVDGDDPETSNDVSSEFELFAVVTHSGTLDAGHYVTYLRLSDKWYKCDDAWITQVSENIVRTAQGYMIFYVQKMLYYKASERHNAL
ncbi:unnamed protein product [Rhodiola kirilowii]